MMGCLHGDILSGVLQCKRSKRKNYAGEESELVRLDVTWLQGYDSERHNVCDKKFLAHAKALEDSAKKLHEKLFSGQLPCYPSA